ncbi:putative Ammonium transporter [Streptomyces viridochromogenes Tue57]|uniref:Ammonium transporter n=1 Tax=Streptomyces viridochromogenes Tue57 TaxID=1160705 RepID=L8PD02_STRVR|nr:putative Ammonium transporter [Streptomyces viridochromogenes Tue57]
MGPILPDPQAPAVPRAPHFVEQKRDGHPTTLGAASGAVAGLGALVIGLAAGVIGTLLIGVFATATMTGGAEGLLHGGGLPQVGKQLVAVVAVAAYVFLVTYGIGKVVDRILGFRAGEEQEQTGLDLTVHAESAYDHGVLGHGAPVTATSSVPSSVPAPQKVKKQA